MLERDIERLVCKYAETKGFLQFKFSSPSHAGVPDRIFISPKGVVLFVEFKAEGKKPTPLQARTHAHLRGHNCQVFVIDNVEDGKEMVDATLD